ncbi:MAG: DUF2125 domain-containing protein [Rhodobacteraceae bacterium]|nr:DUF2125 domain-containing protein [Paracoccaceae bacterium]
MKHFRTTCAVSALVSAALAQGAAADITAEDAWGAMRDLLAGSGYAVDGSETRDGDTLVVSDLVFTMTTTPATDADPAIDAGTTTVDFGTLRFTEAGDGTVRVQMPEVIPITSTFDDPDTNMPVTANIAVTQTGADMIMSGTPDNIRQSFSATAVDIALTSFDAPEAMLPPDAVHFSVNLADISSSATVGQGEPRPMEMSAKARTATFDMAFDVPDEGKGAATGQMNALAFTGTGALPTGNTGGDLYAMLEGGYAVNGSFTYDSGTLSLSGEEEGQSFSVESRSAAGQLDMAIDGDSLTYDVSQADTTVTAMLAELPFPLSLQAAAMKAGITLPISKGDDAQDFKMLVNLQDFVMSDMIWTMIDPQSILPRDPATLLVDLAGKARVFTDLLDPNLATRLEQTGKMPGQLEALDINALKLDLVGAQLTGTGAFTFDNTDVDGLGSGMPRPVGELDLQLSGGNALLDKLSQMGMIGPDEAGGARMMMGLLAEPGDGPDTLKSKLEINAEGHIIANGQRIQ